jgi:hypothetical protein
VLMLCLPTCFELPAPCQAGCEAAQLLHKHGVCISQVARATLCDASEVYSCSWHVVNSSPSYGHV